MTGKEELRVAMVGYAFMGAAHSQAWRTVNRAFDLPVAAVMQAICGRHKERVQAAAEQLGWAEVETDWRRVVERRHRRDRHMHAGRQPMNRARPSPHVGVAGDVHAANPLLRSFTAVVHGFAYLPRGGFTRGFPTDMRGFPTEGDLVADEAARAVRTLARAAAGVR
jgi:hypothetical protein